MLIAVTLELVAIIGSFTAIAIEVAIKSMIDQFFAFIAKPGMFCIIAIPGERAGTTKF
jgi:hypothetical protein